MKKWELSEDLIKIMKNQKVWDKEVKLKTQFLIIIIKVKKINRKENNKEKLIIYHNNLFNNKN